MLKTYADKLESDAEKITPDIIDSMDIQIELLTTRDEVLKFLLVLNKRQQLALSNIKSVLEQQKQNELLRKKLWKSNLTYHNFLFF